MKQLRRAFGGLLLVLLLLLGTASFSHSATDKELDLTAAWRDYMSNTSAVEPAYRFPHMMCFRSAAIAYDLPLTFLLAVARGESDFKATARSRANAHGVMQILWPTTAKHLGIYRLSDLYDPCTNIDAGARYLQELLTRYNGNVHLALAAYNYGPQRIAAHGLDIPDGARWYSGYIFRHLGYVSREADPAGTQVAQLYSELGRTTLVTFGEPYRAEAFLKRLEAGQPELRLDWFRLGVGEFAVVVTYANREEFDASASRLAQAGFFLN